MKKKRETKPKVNGSKEKQQKKTQSILDFCQRTPGITKCPICQQKKIENRLRTDKQDKSGF